MLVGAKLLVEETCDGGEQRLPLGGRGLGADLDVHVLTLKEHSRSDDETGMSRSAAVVLAAAALLAPVAASAGRAAPGSWAQAEIRIVTARGLMGGDPASFRPDDPVTAGELAELLAGLTGRPVAEPADPSAPVTIAQLHARLVRSLGLAPAARRFASQARAAGLGPPGRFGTEVVARLLGFRKDHPQADDALEPLPSSPATRAEAAYSAAKVLRWKGWEAQYARDLAAAFAPEPVFGFRRAVLREAIRLVGYPYVWGGTSERRQAPLGVPVPGGFDCSGFVWRLFRLAPYAAGTPLPELLRGRSTYEMAAETTPAQRLGLDAIAPADLLFFGRHGAASTPREIDHIGVYLGGGWLVQASGQGVSLAPLDGTYRARFAFARRPLAEAGLA